MSRLSKVLAIALLVLMTLAPVASARNRGAVVVRPYYYRVYPYPYYGWGYGPYSPWWGPWPGHYGPYYYAEPTTGEVKIETKLKGYPIYVDGGYAGVTGKLKKFRLQPGNHTIAIRDVDNRPVYEERVYVIAGKTIKIYANFAG
ncbi:MAG: hypothetical protein HY508_07665 [Acidobacteria bacterium]|nr:hypothetical protein [Acidobacteriota bacterium]